MRPKYPASIMNRLMRNRWITNMTIHMNSDFWVSSTIQGRPGRNGITECRTMPSRSAPARRASRWWRRAAERPG
jgi:hypothetical protein